MAWKLDNPLFSLADEETNRRDLQLWEAEKTGGMWEGNNRLPYPITYLIALIIVTAFLVTTPIWGQRPNAKIYAPMVEMMNSPDIQALGSKEAKMAEMTKRTREILAGMEDSRLPGWLDRHPLTWDDLMLIAPQIREIQAAGGKYGLDEYNIVGDQVRLANFQGQIFMGTGKLERKQPWWDNGFTIDVFYVSYFVLAMVIVCKRMPHFSQKPDMSKAAR